MNALFSPQRHSLRRLESPMTVCFQIPSLLTIGSRGYSIDPGCFGGDVARWMLDKLAQQGLEVDGAIAQAAYTWQFHFLCDGIRYRVEVGYRPDRVDEAGAWIASIAPVRRPFLFRLGRSSRASDLGAVDAIHAALSASPGVTDIEWRPSSGRSATHTSEELRVCG